MAPGAHQTAPVMNLEERFLPERLFLAFFSSPVDNFS